MDITKAIERTTQYLASSEHTNTVSYLKKHPTVALVTDVINNEVNMILSINYSKHCFPQSNWCYAAKNVVCFADLSRHIAERTHFSRSDLVEKAILRLVQAIIILYYSSLTLCVP